MIFICQQYQYYHFIYFQSFTYLISDILNLTKCNNLQMECFFFSSTICISIHTHIHAYISINVYMKDTREQLYGTIN